MKERRGHAETLRHQALDMIFNITGRRNEGAMSKGRAESQNNNNK